MSIRKLVTNAKSLVKGSVSGCWTWQEYCRPGNHDHKFGPSLSEYLAQIPFVCVIAAPIVVTGWFIYYGGIFVGVLAEYHFKELVKKLQKLKVKGAK